MKVFYFRWDKRVENKRYNVENNDKFSPHVTVQLNKNRTYWFLKVNCFTDQEPVAKQIADRLNKTSLRMFWQPWQPALNNNWVTNQASLKRFSNYMEEAAKKFNIM